MDCSEFCEHHCAYVDDTLAGVELVRMQRHVAECAKCAGMDARVRRSLLLARNLPAIELSPEFSRKLEARLRDCRAQVARDDQVCANFRAVAAIGAVASVLMLSYMAGSLDRDTTHDMASHDIVLPPVVARASLDSNQPQIVIGANGMAIGGGAMGGVLGDEAPAPEIIAAVSTGMPILPAALFAEQGPIHFVNHRRPVH